MVEITDYSDAEEVKMALTGLDTERKKLIKKYESAKEKAASSLARYDADSDSEIDTTSQAIDATEKARKTLSDAFAALDTNVTEALDIVADYAKEAAKETGERDDSIIVDPDTQGHLEAAYHDNRRFTTKLETLAYRRQEIKDREKASRHREREAKHPQKTEGTVDTRKKYSENAIWKPQNIDNPGVLHSEDNMATLNRWLRNLRSFIRPEDVARHGDARFQGPISNLMSPEVAASIQLTDKVTVPIYTSTSTEKSIVDRLIAKKKVTHSPELLQAEWYAATQMTNESFDCWDARLVSLAGDAELLELYGGDHKILNSSLGNKLMAGLTGKSGKLIRERVIRAREDGKVKDILELVRKIATTEETVNAHTRHLEEQTASLYKLQGGGNAEGAQSYAADHRKCYNCHNEGHIASGCPERRDQSKRPKGPWMQHLADEGLCFRCAKKHDKMCDFSAYKCQYCKIDGHTIDACQKKNREYKKN